MTLKRTMCALLAATMLVPTAVMAETAASAAEVDVEESSAQVSAEASKTDYGLADNIVDGNFLHCFDWKYNDIRAELPNIAAAGFTSIQTSPAQPNGTGTWWWLYQPTGFYVGTNGLGTKEELSALCSEAESYGIKVIVDVVANHLRGDGYEVEDRLNRSSHGDYWHNENYDASDGDRYATTHGKIGMADLNSEHSEVQNIVLGYTKELQGMGVDGIRWDAAKHIGLPSEGCNFWKTVTSQGMYHYGEILNNPGGTNGDVNPIWREYAQYIAVTDSQYGMDTRNSYGGGKAMSGYGNLVSPTGAGVPESKLVYWAESHDNWSNNKDWGWSWWASDNVIDRSYAAVASRNGIPALYFSRPSSTSKDDIQIGQKGSTHFTAPEVAEVNKFKNAMVGKKDYYSFSDGNCSITRQGGGAVIVKGSGSGNVTVPNGGKYAVPGTYTDHVSGGTFTVTESTISGDVGPSGIAVLYDAVSAGGVSATPATGTSFSGTLNVTLKATDVSNATYSTSEGASGSYTDGQTITVGASTAEGSSVTLTLSGKKSDGSSVTATYKYNKQAPKTYPTLNGGGFVFDNSSKNWSTVKAYVYDESGSTTIKNGEWPGVAMTDCGNGYWKYELDSKFSGSNVQVIFNNGSEQIPASQQPGFKMSATDKKLYENDAWTDLPASSSIKVSLAASSNSVKVGDSVTLTATATGASGTVNYTFTEGSNTIQASSTKNTATWTPSTKGTYTIKVTAKDSSGSAEATTSITVTAPDSNNPTVTVDKASGTEFTTETYNVKLTLANATKGTYSVDNGPVKEFTGSQTITIGEGKIADSVIKVDTTATNANGVKKSYSFKYNKKYVVKTGSSSSSAALTTESSGSALASQYKTNAVGVGANKTISVDGDLSDWTSDMLIAQGAANDDPRVYRPNSMYELPVDLYALYGAYDDNNVYLMWEMTNVQDVVAPIDDYPISQGILWQTQELPFFIAVDTGKTSDAIGNSGKLQAGGTIWNSGMTFGSNSFNRLISINTKGGNGPYVYQGDSTGLNPVEVLDAKTSKIKMGYGKGILSSTVKGINGAYGANNNRVVGDVCSDSAAWVDFNTKGHSSGSLDFFYELSIPYDELGITKSDVQSNGIGVMLVATFGMSGMDCLPYDASMNDNADQPDTQSQENNSFEKSDADNITAAFARIGKGGNTPVPPDPTTPLQVNFGADRSAPQYSSTALTLKGIGYGGKAPYTYEFTVDGTVVKAANSTDSCSWTPGSVGTHTIKCKITDSTGTSVTVNKDFTSEASGDVTALTNKSTVSSTTPAVGTAVTIKGAASGGTGSYTYQFYYKKDGATSWSTFGSNYQTANTATLKASSAGKFIVRTYAKDGKSSVAKDFTITFTNALTNKSTVSSTTPAVGTAVTIKGAASGGTGSYTYQFYYKKDGASSWSTFGSNYQTANTATLKASSAGKFIVRTYAKDGKSSVAKDFTITFGTAALTNKCTTSSTNPLINYPVTIKGAGAGGSGSYTYQFYYKKDGATSWSKFGSDYQTATTATLKASSAGKFIVRTYVKDSKGASAVKDFTITFKNGDLTNISKVSATTPKAGTAVTITGAGAGGSGSYTYQFYYKKDGATSWSKFGSNYQTATTATLKASSAGKFIVRTYVKDSKGTSVAKDFTITFK